MNLIHLCQQFPDQQACIAHLERLRWPVQAVCPLCGSDHVARKADKVRVGRWNCHDCKSRFNVLLGTIFRGTHLPLQTWFLAIALMVHTKKSLSSHQRARDLGLGQRSAWSMQQRIRQAMATDERHLLQGIIEADETYVGGKPRTKSQHNKRGRGTPKVPVLGAVQRNGDVQAEVTDDTQGKTILAFIKRMVNPADAVLITDAYRAYRTAGETITDAVVDHQQGYVHPQDAGVHINTIEGFWGHLKRAWYGAHHRYTRRWMPLFVAEACWKYNHREDNDGFNGLLRACLT